MSPDTLKRFWNTSQTETTWSKRFITFEHGKRNGPTQPLVWFINCVEKEASLQSRSMKNGTTWPKCCSWIEQKWSRSEIVEAQKHHLCQMCWKNESLAWIFFKESERQKKKTIWIRPQYSRLSPTALGLVSILNFVYLY